MQTQKTHKFLLINVCVILIFLCVGCCVCSVFNYKTNFIFASSNLSSAKSMVVIEAQSNKILYSKNEKIKLPMASTTKIVTALTVLNNCSNLEELVKIDNKAVGVPGTSIYLKYGEEMKVIELLYGMMLPSGNDAATALAIYVGGSVENFTKLMNDTAKKCGANDSNFSNPHGLDDKNHYTTAYDLAKITAKALENETFKEIVTTKNIRIKGYGDQKYRYLRNKNKLLTTLAGCIGVKTGFTNNAGRCLVSACERDGLKSVCVVLNCGPMFEESFDLLSNVYNEFEKVELLKDNEILGEIGVCNGTENYVKFYVKHQFCDVIKKSEVNEIKVSYVMPKMIEAPIKKDQIIGEVQIYLKNNLLFSEKIYTMDNVKSIRIKDNFKEVLSRW